MEGMENMNASKYIRKLIDFLNQNTKYYNEGKPHITDEDWDKVYFELEECIAQLSGAFFISRDRAVRKLASLIS